MTDETLKQHNDAVLQAIGEMSKQINARIDDLEKSVNAQFDAIRDGIEHNYVFSERIQGGKRKPG